MWRAARPFGLVAIFALFFGVGVGCGSDEPGGDAVPDDLEDVDSETSETGTSDDDVEVGVDEEVEVDTGPTPECAPGQARCAQGADEVAELCDDEGFWQPTTCGPGEICFEGACEVPGVCEPQRVDSCSGCNAYVGCNSVGTREGEFDVPFNRTCIEEDGVAQLVPRACNQGQGRCIDARRLEVCDECGLGFQFATDCTADDETTLCDEGRCLPLCEFIKKRETYIGCEYWAVDLDNAFVPGGGGFIDADGQPFVVVVSNPNDELTAEVTVSMRSGEVARVTVGPGELEAIELHYYDGPSDLVGTPLSDIQGTMIGYEGFLVESTVPIVAYQFNPLNNENVFSNDASLLFPTSSYGTEYLVMTRRQTFDSLKGYVTVVAVQEGLTEVTVELPPYTLENPVETLSGFDVVRSVPIPRMRGGDVYTVQLEQFMVLNIETDRPGADLTGTRVTSNRPVAVFGGSEAANVPNDDSCVYRPSFDDWVCEATRLSATPRPCTNAAGVPDIELCADYITCCADHLEHQMLPLFAWGRVYNATRSAPRGDEPDYWRIMAGTDNVTVSLIGLPEVWPLPNLIPRPNLLEVTLDKAEWFEVPSPVDFEIVADGPIMVGQFLAAEFAPYPQSITTQMPPHQDAGSGDPAFILGVPVEQYRDDYTFLCPEGFEFDYVTITAPVDSEVILNGEVVPEEEWSVFGRGDYMAARIRLGPGVHRATGTAPFGIMVHGYDSFVSYGYAGGLDLRRIFGRE